MDAILSNYRESWLEGQIEACCADNYIGLDDLAIVQDDSFLYNALRGPE
jgi:hypothetical protein